MQEAAHLDADFALVAEVSGQLILTPASEDNLAAGWKPHEDSYSPVGMLPNVRFGVLRYAGSVRKYCGSMSKLATVRFYIDADVLGLAKILVSLRSDVTYPGDPGGVAGPACDAGGRPASVCGRRGAGGAQRVTAAVLPLVVPAVRIGARCPAGWRPRPGCAAPRSAGCLPLGYP